MVFFVVFKLFIVDFCSVPNTFKIIQLVVCKAIIILLDQPVIV